MIGTWFKKTRWLSKTPDASALSLALHSASRQPVFYTAFGVPDSFDGRFEMLVLHAHQVIRRLRRDGDEGKELAQALFDSLTNHFDEALRAIGVGDMSIGKRVKGMGRATYGRFAAYDTGLDAAKADEGFGELQDALRRNLYGTVPDVSESAVQAMAAYSVAVEAHLSGVPIEDIRRGRGLFPDPAVMEPSAPLTSDRELTPGASA